VQKSKALDAGGRAEGSDNRTGKRRVERLFEKKTFNEDQGESPRAQAEPSSSRERDNNKRQI